MTDEIYLNGATLMTTPTHRVVSIARDAGYAGIEARAERLLRNPEEVRATAGVARPGEVLTLNGVSLSLRPDGNVDRDVLEADVAARLSVCQHIGTGCLLAVAPRVPGLGADRAMAGIRDALELVRDRSAARSIRVGFEFLGFADCPINTPALAAEAIDGLDSIDLVLDSCHWHASGAQPLDGFPVDRLALVHLNDVPPKPPAQIEDSDRVLPGEGVIKLRQLVSQLRSLGYSGPWSLETFNPAHWEDDPVAVARKGAEAMASVIGVDRRLPPHAGQSNFPNVRTATKEELER